MKGEAKRLIRTAAYRRRNELIPRVLDKMAGESFGSYRSRIVWGPVLPQDSGRLVRDEEVLVGAGIYTPVAEPWTS